MSDTAAVPTDRHGMGLEHGLHPSVRLLGVEFAVLSPPQALYQVAARPAGAPFAYVVTPNADHLIRLARDPATFLPPNS